MFDIYPCSICGETGHKIGRCSELSSNKVPPAERGEHGDDEDDSLRCMIQLFPLKEKARINYPVINRQWTFTYEQKHIPMNAEHP